MRELLGTKEWIYIIGRKNTVNYISESLCFLDKTNEMMSRFLDREKNSVPKNIKEFLHKDLVLQVPYL